MFEALFGIRHSVSIQLTFISIEIYLKKLKRFAKNNHNIKTKDLINHISKTLPGQANLFLTT